MLLYNMNISSKLTKIAIIGVVLIGLLLTLYLQHKQIQSLQKSYSIAVNNEKAASKQNRVFQLRVDQLQYFGDSITLKLDSVRKALKIKDKAIQSMQYIQESITKPNADIILFHDTIFIKDLKIDTMIGDQFYSLKLYLAYPDTLMAKPAFINEKYIFVSSKKETIDPPKKFFLLRWFQKKQIILTVDIIDKNPYVENKNQRLIEIIK